ncbi:G8 domain-containing protein, partial [Flavihumibacter petaseus]
MKTVVQKWSAVGIVLLLLQALCVPEAFAQVTTQTYNWTGSAQTFVVPAGVTSVQVELWGGGGAGGGTSANQNKYAGGGGGGAYFRATSVVVTPGSSITVTVGRGGQGVLNANGPAGEASTFASASPVTANGGGGGGGALNTNNTAQAGSAGAAATGTFNGGAGIAGSTSNTYSGGGGGGAGNNGNGSAGNQDAGGNGGGGTVGGAAGGDGLTQGAGNGGDVTGLAGGGGGGRGNGSNNATRRGGNGGNGRVIVTYTLPPYTSTKTGNWNDPTVWDANAVPVAGSTVIIAATHTVTANVSSAALATVTVNGTLDLTSNTVNGNNTSTFTVSGSGTLKVGAANFPSNYTSVVLGAGSTVEYNGTAQTVNPRAYSNLTLSGSGIKTLTSISSVTGTLTLGGTATATTAANLAVGQNLVIGDGTTLTIGGFTFSVGGTTTIGGGTSGTLVFGSTTGTKTFTGAVTLLNGASWTNSSTTSTTLSNGLSNAGTFVAGSGALTLNGSVTNTGTFNTSFITTAPVPAGITWGGTFIYSALSGSQVIMGGTTTYNNLQLLNTSGSNTANGNISVAGALTTTAGGTFVLGNNLLTGTLSSITSNGTITTTNTTSLPIPAGKTWGGTVSYIAPGGTQTIVAGTYNNLRLDHSGSTSTAGGDLTVNGTLTQSSSTATFDLSTFALSGSLTAISNSGTIKTQNTSNTPLPSGKNWLGAVEFYGSGSQTIPQGTYESIILSNTAGATLTGSSTVSNGLSLSSKLHLVNADLSLGFSGAVIGAGASQYIVTDGTGQLKRSVGTSFVTFPVGNSAYNPITFKNSSLPSDTYGIRVEDGAVPNAASSALTVNRIWRITEATPGGSQLVVDPVQFNDLETSANFSTGTDLIGLYTGSTWIKVNATYNNVAPYTFSATNPLVSADLTSGGQYIAIGKDYGFVAAPNKFTVTVNNPTTVTSGAPFSVTVTAYNNFNELSNVNETTSFTLSNTGGGSMGGTVIGSIPAGLNSVVVNNVILTELGTGVTITATDNPGEDEIPNAGTSTAFNVIASSGSDLAAQGGEAGDIDYKTKLGTITQASDGFKVWSFDIRDGGASLNDPDNLSTILSSLTIVAGANNTVASWSNTIEHVALFDGSTKIADGTVTGQQIDFTAISNAVAADGAAKTLDLYITFKTTVNDGERFQFAIGNANATASAAGSLFNPSFATTSSSLSSNNNTIQVYASEIKFSAASQTLSDVEIGETQPVEVIAVDIYNNLDKQFTSSVTLNATGGTFINPQVVSAVQGVATFHPAFSAQSLSVTLTATTTGLANNTSPVSDNFAVNGFAGDVNDKFRTNQTGNWTDPGIWEQSHDGTNWVPAVTYPTATTSSSILLYAAGFSADVTIDGFANIEIDQTTITGSGSILHVPDVLSGSLTVVNGTGVDLKIENGGVLKVESFGEFENRGEIVTDGTSNLTVSSAATYRHNQLGGTIPAAFWTPNDVTPGLLEITGITSMPTWPASTFGDVRITGLAGSVTTTNNLSLGGNLEIIALGGSNTFALSGTLVVGKKVTIGGVVTLPSFALNSGQELKVNAGANLRDDGTISGSGFATILGTFSTANTNGFNGGAATAFSIPNGSISLGASSVVDYVSASGQTITPFNYINLSNSGNGARTLSGTGTIGVSNIFTAGSGAYTSTGSTVDFNGSGAQNIPALTNGYGGLTVSNSGTKSLTAITTVNGTLTINASANLDVTSNNYGLTIGGNFVNNNGSGGFIAQGGTVTFNAAAGTQTLNNGGASFNNILHNTAGTLQVTGTALVVNGTLTNGTGNFDANTQAVSVTGVTTVNSGNYLASTGTQTFTGGLTVAGGTFTGSTGTVAAGNVTQSGGTLIAPSGTFTVNGNWSRTNGTFTAGGNTVTFISTGTQTISTSQSFANVLHNSAGTVQLSANMTTTGTFQNTAGTFNANTSTHTVTGLATVSGGNYAAGSNTQTFNGGLTISGGTFTGNTGNLTVTNLTMSSGALTAPSGTFSLSGNWVNNGGVFTPGTNTITFAGTGSQSIGGSQPTTFNNITLNNTGTGVSADINTTATAITFSNASTNTNTLTVSNGVTLTANSITVQSDLGTTRSVTAVLTGAGTVNTGALTLGQTGAASGNNTRTTTLTSSVATINITGNLTVNANTSGGGGSINHGTFNFSTGSITVGGSLVLNATSSGNSTALFTMATGSQNGTLFLGGATPVTVSGVNTNTFTANGSAATVNYNRSGDQQIFATTYFNLILSGSGNKTTAANITANGQLNVNAGVALVPAAANTVGGSGTLTGAGTVLVTRTAATPDFLSQYTITTKTLTGLTVDYNATGAQTVNALNYNNLRISGARTTNSVTLANGGTIGIAGTFTTPATFTSGSYIVTNNTVNFNGTSVQDIPSLAPGAFNNLTLTNAAGATISTNVSINGVLNFASGKITTGANSLVLGGLASVTNAGPGKYVFGNLRRIYNTGSNVSKTFDVGDATNYTPATVSFASVTSQGGLTIHTTGGDHPQIATSTFDPNKTVSRYWTLDNSSGGVGFTTFDATFTWVPGDVDAGVTPAFVYGSKYSGSSWQNLSMGIRNGSSAQVLGLTSMSDFQFGDCSAPQFGATTVNDVTCNGGNDGSLTLVTTGGVGPFTYVWSSAVAGFTNPGTANLSNLKAGDYVIQVTALGGCSNSTTYTVHEPVALTAAASGDNITCFNAANGKITVSSPAGGSGEYEFRINGGTWQEGLVFSNLAPNTYTIDVRDKNNPACIVTLPGTVTIGQPAVLSASAAGDDVTCYNAANGSITVSSPAGGSGEYEFRINGGTWQEGLVFSNLAPDTYTIDIRDKNVPTCIVTLPGTVTIDQPAVLSAAAAGDDVTCYNAANGKITISSPTGGSGEFEFRINGGTWQEGLVFSNLAPDTYNIDIRDKNNPACIITLPGTVTIDQPAVLSASAAGDDVTCFNAANGKITVSSPTGGSGEYEFRLNGGT